MFTHYTKTKRLVNGVNINFRIGGTGPALLLLHGHPQTHFIWHKVADELAKNFTVVVADLRGYGDSDKPIEPNNKNLYSNRTMAQDMVDLMMDLGFKQFSILAHDRGARVSHRLALDHPNTVKRMILLDIAPTLAMYEQANLEFATAYWHWFFLIRPAPLPETLIESDPELYLKGIIAVRSSGMKPFTEEAYSEYLRCLRLPGAANAICEDYRATASIDLDHDRNDLNLGNKLTCPLLVIWGSEGTVGRCFEPLTEWKKLAHNVQGKAIKSGHYIAEEVPDDLVKETLDFMLEQ